MKILNEDPEVNSARDLRTMLRSELGSHNLFFDSLVDMIPVNLYVSGNIGDKQYNVKYKKGQHPDSREAKRARNKQTKVAKLDPKRAGTALETKKRMESDDDDKTSLTRSKLATTEVTVSSSRIETLRAKLHAKLAEKRGNRPGDDSNESQTISKRAARRAEKQRRIEAAKARKQKDVGHVNKRSGTSETFSRDTNKNEEISSSTRISVQKDISNIDFGAIAGLKEKAYYSLENKSLAKHNKKRSLDRLLQDAENKRQRLSELKAGTEEDKEKAKKIQWGDTFKEATGQRVRDDPAKIKRAMKRKAKEKEKSTKAWKARQKQTDAASKERQKIRSHNLNQRKKGGEAGASLSRKGITENDERVSPASSGRTGGRAGFEGKKRDRKSVV